MTDSIFDSDPMEIPASQRLAQAHAASITRMEQDEDDLTTDMASHSINGAPGAKTQPSARSVDILDESAFPTLGGSNQGKAKPLWGVRPASRRPMTPIASQVVPTAGLITDTVKLESSQQQSRSLGKRPTGEVVKAIQKTNDVTIQTSTASKTGTITFLIKGAPDNVAQARRGLLRELGKKVTLNLLVPGGARPHIVGAKGRILKGITDRTGVKVQLPRREASDTQEDPDEMVEVTLEGDFDGVAQARAEIEAIVSEKTSTTTIKITSIPGEFYGLIALRLQDASGYDDIKINIPSIAYTEDIPSPITLTGDKDTVGALKTTLEQLHSELQAQTISTSLPVPKKQHSFIAPSIATVLSQSGCSVVIPPPSSSSDSIIIRGPAVNIGAGITMVMEAAQSMTLESLEISRAHPDAPSQLHHAINLTKVLIHDRQITTIEKETSTTISVPSEQESLVASKVVYDISGKDASGVSNARKRLVAAVNAVPPNKVSSMQIEPLLHKQIIGSKQKNVVAIRKQFNVQAIFPAYQEADASVILNYVGDSRDVNSIAESMQAAVRTLSDLVSAAGEIASETILIPVKHHAHLTGKNGTTLNAITGGSEAVVRVLFADGSPEAITIKGPRKDVERVAKELQTTADEATGTEIANSQKVEFDFPAQFTKNLIGRGGSNISKIRDELGVKIDVGDEGRIVVQGPQRNVEEARARITLLGDRLQDETTLVLKIPADFHGQIIGQGGKLVKRLEEKYQVQINFPRNGDDEQDDTLGRNEVSVKGGKKGATGAKQEILELFHYESEHSFTLTIEVLQKSVSQIVGKNGQVINDIKDDTNTRIDIEKTSETLDEDSKVTITIKGRKVDVEKAKAAIGAIDSEIADLVTETLHVDPAHHRNLIGPGGSSIRDIVVKAGGPEDSAQRARMVRFPKAGNDSSEIVLRGPRQIVNKIKKSIERIVGTPESQHNQTVSVPKDQVKVVIGRGGSKKSELESKHSVVIDIPRASDASTTIIKVLGKEESVLAAIQDIEELIKVPESETVQVPRSLHRIVAENGAFIRRLRNDFQVAVDHEGQSIPKAMTSVKSTANGTARIDDEVENEEYPYHVLANSSNTESGDIPWVLKGELQQIAKAKKLLLNAINNARTQTHTAQLHIPCSKHRFIIGQGGSTINSIREQSNTKIDVPKSQVDEVITIKGSLEGCEQARTLIIEAIQKKT